MRTHEASYKLPAGAAEFGSRRRDTHAPESKRLEQAEARFAREEPFETNEIDCWSIEKKIKKTPQRGLRDERTPRRKDTRFKEDPEVMVQGGMVENPQ
jgi:hypothetical protein